jgi:hypothetical protein
VASLLARRREPFGVEALGLVPERRMPVDDPGCEHDVGAGGDVVAGQLVVRDCPPAHEGRRGIQPHRLLDRHRRVWQPRRVLRGRYAADRVNFIAYPFLHIRMPAEQTQREGQRR